tara:strand:- start:635 stop:2620 length:1986 start_codon:yes stop_codon:yes gene_type:complete
MSDESNYYGNLARAGAEGLLMGFGGEAEAYLKSKILGTTYEEELDKIEKSYGKFKRDNKAVAFGTEVAAGILPTLAALLAPVPGSRVGAAANIGRMGQALKGFLRPQRVVGDMGRQATRRIPRRARRLVDNRLTRATGTGATTGAISGYGSAEKDQYGRRDRAGAAREGALIGAFLNPALQEIGGGGLALARNLRNRFRNPTSDAVTREAVEVIQNRLGPDVDISEALETVTQQRGIGVPTTLATVSDDLGRLATSTAQQSPDAARTFSAKLPTESTSRDRVRDQLQTRLTDKNFADFKEEILEARKTRANELYEVARRSSVVIDDKDILDFINSPRLKKYISAAGERQSGASQRAKLSGDEDIGINIQVDSSGNVTGLDLNAIEQIKRAMDGDINALMKSGDPSELIKDKNALLSAVENLDPKKYGEGVEAFALARKTFKGDSEIADAVDLGSEFMNANKSAAEFKKVLSDMTEGERDAFMVGAMKVLTKPLDTSTSQTKNYAEFINSPNVQEKLEAMLPDVDDGGFTLLKNALIAENEFFKRASSILRSSRSSQAKESGNLLRQGATEIVLDNMSGGLSKLGLLRPVINLISDVKTPDSVKERIAELLVGTPEEVATAVKSIEKLTSKAPSTGKLRQEFREEVVGGATRLVESESDDTY